MGLFFSKLINSLSNKEARILMLGLDAAGKTSILYKLKLDENVQTIPTIGFNVEKVQYNKLVMTIFDIGGQDKIRPLWRYYFENNDAIIFVIDSNDKDRLHEAKEVLHNVLNSFQLEKCKVLIYANKQDLPYAQNAKVIAETLQLNSLKQEWFLQPCSALSGNGLFEGLDWLNNKL